MLSNILIFSVPSKIAGFQDINLHFEDIFLIYSEINSENIYVATFINKKKSTGERMQCISTIKIRHIWSFSVTTKY